MNRRSLLIVSIAGIALAAACAGKPGERIDLANACNIENEKKYVEVSGFLDDKGGVFCSNIGGGDVKCGFTLREAPGSEKTMSADIVEGTWANNVEKLDRDYKKEDIKIHDKDGNIINMSEKVRLTGTMSVTPDLKVCMIKVDRIEK